MPTTVAGDAGRGVGSLQEWAPEGLRTLDSYGVLDRERLGVFDYIAGNTDRHLGNLVTQEDGRPAAIDNGFCFPTAAGDPLRSALFREVMDRDLSPAVVAELASVDRELLVASLLGTGLEQEAVDGAMARLTEAASGRITGDAYDGTIVDEYWATLKG